MASPTADPDAAASRTSWLPSPTPAAPGDASKRPDRIQLSAADCSVGDDSGAVASSVAFGASTSSSHAEQQQSPPPPPPPFEPLFALLTNTTTGATVHPRVHYLFSDDDAAIPTAEIAAAAAQHDDDNDEQQQHRSLVVDLAPTPARDAWTVSCASSLGPEFAVTAAALAKQQSDSHSSSAADPTAGGGSGGSAAATSAAALLLHVEGVSRDPVDLRSSASAVGSAASLPLSGSGGGAREDVEALADDFRRRMGVLKKVVGEGEKRRAVTAQQQQHGHDDVAAAAESNEIHDPGTLRSGTASQTHDAATNTY